METTTHSLPAHSLDQIRPSVRRDLLVVAAVTIVTFFVSSLLELTERVLAFTRPFEAYQIDELPVTFLAMVLALAWFSWRRSRQAVEQINLRLRAQQALMAREAQFRLLFEETLSGSVLADADGTIRLCNPAAIGLLGLDDAEAPMKLGDFYADTALWRQHCAQLERGERIDAPTLELRRADGSTARVVAKLGMMKGVDGQPEVHLYMTDITELTRTQRELADALAENRLLSQRYVALQEEERRHLARELHDELGQSLNAIKVDAVTIREQSEGLPDIRRGAQAIVDVSTQVYQVVRSLTRRLRPVALDELGLTSAVQFLVEEWQRRHKDVRCSFQADDDLEGLAETVNITVYRLVQECLTNIAKHAQAHSVSIAIERRTGAEAASELAVSVADDGCGFDPGAPRQGLGLVGLRERVEALGGRFEVSSAPGRGLRVEAVIPL